MDRLTREEIVEAFRLGKVHCSTQTFNALCDMALHSLESVRSEVLDELTKHELPHRGNDAEGYALVRLDDVCAAIRTLKREPKAALSPARVAEGEPLHESTATAPDTPVTVNFGVTIRSDGELGRLIVEQFENRIVLTSEQAVALAAQIQERLKP